MTTNPPTPLVWSKYADRPRDDRLAQSGLNLGYIAQAERVLHHPSNFARVDIEKAANILYAQGRRKEATRLHSIVNGGQDA